VPVFKFYPLECLKIDDISFNEDQIAVTPCLLMLKFILPIIFFLITGCHGAEQKNLVLLDFESDSELDKVKWKCHTLFRLSNENATHGSKSLKFEFYPSAYPGFSPVLETSDWINYDDLSFDVYNPETKKIEIVVRIDDREDAPGYTDRYNRSFSLSLGLNRISIPFDTLITSGAGRKLDLKTIQALVIFMVDPLEKVTLYVDYIRLDSDNAGR